AIPRVPSGGRRLELPPPPARVPEPAGLQPPAAWPAPARGDHSYQRPLSAGRGGADRDLPPRHGAHGGSRETPTAPDPPNAHAPSAQPASRPGTHPPPPPLPPPRLPSNAPAAVPPPPALLPRNPPPAPDPRNPPPGLTSNPARHNQQPSPRLAGVAQCSYAGRDNVSGASTPAAG